MEKILKIFIAIDVVFTCISTIADIMLEHTLPEKMQDYIATIDSINNGLLGTIGILLCLLLMILVIISWIGLWKLWRPARMLYSLCCLLGPFLYLVLDPVVYYTPIGAVLGDFSVLSAGIILCLLYFTDLKRHFKKSAPNLAFNSDG